MPLLTSIRKLLTEADFDWDNGVLVVPLKDGSKNAFIGIDNPALDVEFSLNYRQDETTLPIFTAEDPVAMYFLCTNARDNFSTFHKVEASYLRGKALEGIKGYPFGNTLTGVDLTFTAPLEIMLTIPAHTPYSFVGCPQIHLYCVGTDLKEAMDIFTTRILTGYLNTVKAREEETEEKGYLSILRKFFDGLKVVKKELPAIAG